MMYDPWHEEQRIKQMRSYYTSSVRTSSATQVCLRCVCPCVCLAVCCFCVLLSARGPCFFLRSHGTRRGSEGSRRCLSHDMSRHLTTKILGVEFSGELPVFGYVISHPSEIRSRSSPAHRHAGPWHEKLPRTRRSAPPVTWYAMI